MTMTLSIIAFVGCVTGIIGYFIGAGLAAGKVEDLSERNFDLQCNNGILSSSLRTVQGERDDLTVLKGALQSRLDIVIAECDALKAELTRLTDRDPKTGRFVKKELELTKGIQQSAQNLAQGITSQFSYGSYGMKGK